MARSWTPAQLASINTRGQTLLVSAAAGAGKTASLTERIIRRLTDPESPAEISRMLIVTFTRAAASELRERISAALSEALSLNPTSKHLSRQLIQLSEAQISTIDSFFADVVRSNFSSLGLPPKFRMADSAELSILKLSMMNELIDAFYKRGAEYGHFFDHFSSIRSDRDLASVFLSLYENLLRHPDGIAFLKKNADTLRNGAECDYFSTAFGEITAKNAEDLVIAMITMYANAYELFENDEAMRTAYEHCFADELEFCRVLLATLKYRKYAEAQNLIREFEPARLPAIKRGYATPESEFFRNLRSELFKKLKTMRDKCFLLSEADIARAMKESAEVSYTLKELLLLYDERIHEEKLRRSICDFDDIRRYTYELLVSSDGSPTPLAVSYSERFDEIYIDEYQDVDSVQDLIFSAIAKPDNRFMVGDIKQSIYGFRGANPSVFASYRKSFPKHGTSEADGSPSAAIYMSNNFRCDPPVINFVNLVCGSLFSTCSGGLAYQREDDLIASKSIPDGTTPHPVEVVVLSNDEQKAMKDMIDKSGLPESPEAVYIVNRIRDLIENGKKADGSRIIPSDIAVLARSKTTLVSIATELKKANIPSCISAEEEFLENPEVLLLLSLLNTIDNPRRDVYLAGALHSPLYGFTLDDLTAIRIEADESFSLYDALIAYSEKHEGDAIAKKCALFREELDTYRSLAASLPVDRLIRHIFGNPRLALGGGLSAILPSRRHLLRLYEYARKFESGAFRGLYQFVSYIEELIRRDTKMELPSEENGASIKLMTIHKSKGLEFPVCFLADTGKKFNLRDASASLLFEESLGVAMKLSDESGFGRINTPMRDALAARITEKAIEEEMRVLYVALTRARERLIVTTRPLSYTSLSKTVLSRVASFSRYSIMECHSYIEWILSAVENRKSFGLNDEDIPVTVSVVEDISIAPVQKSHRRETEKPILSEEQIAEYMQLFRERFAFRYPYAELSRLPAKLSVSTLSPAVLDGTDTPEERFKSGNDLSARKGTATHCFLQFCDFKKAKESGSRSELERLTRERFLSPDTAELCRIDELDLFFESELLSELLNAKEIYREKRFNIFLPAIHFTENEERAHALSNEKILVQGVIDVFFVNKNGELILCDYKTDRLSDAEKKNERILKSKMKERHGEQLTYYALALKELTGQLPDRVLIYVTAIGRAIEIDVDPVEK